MPSAHNPYLLTYTVWNTVSIDGEKLETFEKMIDMLEDNDDVQNVYHNAEIAE